LSVPDLPVRPDGRISVPLIEDIVAAGKTPTQLAREIESRLKTAAREMELWRDYRYTIISKSVEEDLQKFAD